VNLSDSDEDSHSQWARDQVGREGYMYVYMYVYGGMCVCICMYVWRDGEMYVCIFVSICLPIYLYV
jgi:hypothetical protein